MSVISFWMIYLAGYCLVLAFFLHTTMRQYRGFVTDELKIERNAAIMSCILTSLFWPLVLIAFPVVWFLLRKAAAK